MGSKQAALWPGRTGNPDWSNIMKITAARQQAIEAIRALDEESSKQEVLAVFSQARKVFKGIKAFFVVESAAWDMALAGGCWGRVHSGRTAFAAQIDC